MLSILVASFTGIVWAEEVSSESGFYSIENNDEQIEFEVQTSQGAIISTQSALVNGETEKVDFYPNSEKIVVTVSGITSGAQCLVLLVTGENLPDNSSQICYINQVEANASQEASFTVYPMLPTTTTKMSLYITSNADGFETKKVDLNYAVGYTLGDVDNDGKILPTDALAVLKHCVLIEKLSGSSEKAADVDKDGKVLPTDALTILKYCVRIITEF